MKKSFVVMTLILSGFTFLSCDCNGDATSGHTDDYTPDTSLAGSVYMEGYTILEAEVDYEGTDLSNYLPEQSFLDVWKVSDTEIYFYATLVWDNAKIRIQIPIVPLTGRTYDVAFDHMSDNVFVMYNDTKYFSNTAKVKGHIRRNAQKSINKVTRTPFVRFNYECDIDIICTTDDKILNLKIISIKP